MYQAAPPPPPPAPTGQQQPEQQQYQSSPSLVPEYAPTTSQEPYGAVQVPMTKSNSSVTQRRPFQSSTRPSPYVLKQPDYTISGSAVSSTMDTTAKGPSLQEYQHNGLVAVFLGVPMALFLWNHVSPIPLQTFLYVSLVLYAVDLAQLQEWTLAMVWTGYVGIMPIVNLWTTLAEDGEGGIVLLWTLLRFFTETMLLVCMATWATLQLKWMYKESRSLMVLTEHILHTCLVPVSSAMITFHSVTAVQHYLGMDKASTLAPHLFAFLMMVSMLGIGCVGTTKDEHMVSSTSAKLHSTILLLVPGSMHVLMFRKRILSFYASYDDWCDVVLVWSIPYLLLYIIHMVHWNETRPGPYQFRLLFGNTGNATLRGAFVPMVISLVASLALEEKYLIPLCQQVAYPFVGHELPSKPIVGLLLTVGIIMTLFALWVNGRKSTITNKPLFGEYHEDVVQLSLALTGLTVGRAVGMPWTLTPLPILAFLGFIIWTSTRMLRYLCILLFVIHSTGVVLFSYRYAGLETTIPLPIPNATLNMFRLGMSLIIVSLVIFLVMGLSVRSSGGLGAKLLRAYDGAGSLMVLYTLFLTVAECTLLKLPMPYQDLSGIELHESNEPHTDFAYKPYLVFGTSLMVSGIAVFLMRYKHVASDNAVFCTSWAVGKAVAVFIDSRDQNKPADKKQDHAADAMALLIRCVAAGLTIMIMLGPRVVLEPVHVKASAVSWKKGGGKSSSSLPSGAGRTVTIYGLLILPLTLAASVPIVLQPLVAILSGRSGGGGVYQSLKPPISEVVGFASTLWGLSMVSMLNHFLPDGGGESWKKGGALAFLMGIGLVVSAPTLPDWMLGKEGAAASMNPYAVLSSLGTDLAKTGRSGAGGWGVVAAALATLLAITGPLELRERQTAGRDNYVLARVMLFSLMFGCGVAWFITIQSMSEEAFLPLFVTTSACMAMSFFGTVSAVLGYSLELESFQDAIQVVQVWAVAFPIFGLMSATAQFAKEVAHPFGVGGWLSTYLVVCGCMATGFTVAMRSRTTKSAATRGVSNLSCIFAWFCSMVVLYGRYGIAGLDANYNVTSVFGFPAPIFGTFALSLIMVGLEGESATSRRGRVSRMGSTSKPATSSFGITFKDLNRSNSFAPLMLSIAIAFLIASLYAVFVRGCGILQVATSHGHLYDAIYRTDSTDEDLSSLAEKNMIHSRALMTSARLAGSSFWTAKGINGPLLQLAGLLSTLPSLYLTLRQQWYGDLTSWSSLALAVPVNLFPLVVCRAVPSIQGLAGLCLLSGILQLMTLQSQERRGKMRI